jgi:integrase
MERAAGTPIRPPSGHVFRIDRARGPVWYAKYRLPDGRQVQTKLGPAWSERGRPPAGYFTKRIAEDWLRRTLDEARRGTLVGMVRTGATFADAAAEFLRYAEHDRAIKPSTLRGYRSIVDAYLLPAFGSRPVEGITSAEVEHWRAGLEAGASGKRISNSTRNRILVLMNGIFRRAVKVYGLPFNPVAAVERQRVRYSGDIEVFSPEEVLGLVRAAPSEQDGAVYLTAAFTGLRRGELLALRWRDVDFAGETIRVRSSYAGGQVTAPKSGKVRSVPMAPDVSQVLARLAGRERFTADDDLVFPGQAGDYLDGSALRRRYAVALKRAGLRPLRFHDLRHTFGTRMIGVADIRRVQEWMGHADVQTTMKYLHYVPRADDARLVASAFATGVEGASAASRRKAGAVA